MRVEGYLELSGDVGLRSRRDHREIPPLILNRARDVRHRTDPQVGAYAQAGQSSPTRNKLVVYLLVPEMQLQPIPGAEPIVRPGLSALPLPPDPASQQISVVRVAASIVEVVIKEPGLF